MNRKYKSLTQNTVLFAISSFGTKFLSFLLIPLYTNVLSTADYGIADVLSTTTSLLIIVFTLNVADGVLLFGLDKKNDPIEILSYGFRVFFTGLSVLTFGMVLITMFHVIDWPVWYFIFVFLYFIASEIYQIFSNYLRAVDDVAGVALTAVISSGSYLLSNVILLLITDMGLKGYLLSTIIGPAVGSAACFLRSKLSLNDIYKAHCNAEVRRALIRYCFPLVFNSLALWINSCLDRYFITGMIGSSENGIYSVANKIPIILSTFYTVFSQAWTLSAVKEYDKDDEDHFFSQTYEIYNGAMCIVCSFIILMNIPLARILYAKDFFEAWKYSSVLLVGTLFNSLTAFIGSLFSASKKSSILASTTVISAIVNTIMNITLIPRFGVMGASIATAVALFLMWAIRILCVRSIVRLEVNYFKHISVYILICVQVVLEHLNKHCYFWQIIIFAGVLLLNFTMIKKIIHLAGTILTYRNNRS